MKGILSFCFLLLVFTNLSAQHSIKLIIKNGEEKSLLADATAVITALNKSAVSDSAGIVFFNDIPAGSYAITISHVGFKEAAITIVVPQQTDTIQEVILKASEEDEEEVIVTATRISRTINDLPTRVETISGEELTEKGNMKPGDIRMLLNESTGIQTQQTSATSYNSSIRIQGLDGRYTQILRDGFPLYAGFSGGLSLMQIAPLDLKQIEVIKGSSSTLYGGGAIAGLVNLVSKVPTSERELSFLANATTAGGLDLSGFYSERFSKIGLTVFLSKNSGAPYDPADIGLTAIPKFNRYTINPTLFLYGTSTTATIGFSYITEERTGGSIDYIKKGTTGYFEKNNTDRFTTQFQVNHQLSEKAQLHFKNSYSRFNRLIQVPAFTFEGLQQTTFSEATYINNRERANWVLGANFLTDDFEKGKQSNALINKYHFNTIGAFVQNTWNVSDQFVLETGLRGDYVKQYGFELLPRFSAMLKINPKLTARLGGGFGYKTPTVFNEEGEKMQFQNIVPIDQRGTINERSLGGNFDINYRTQIGALGLAVNSLLFYTKLNKPLVLDRNSAGNFEFKNAAGFIDTKGLEMNLRFIYSDFKLFVGYTFADVASHFNGMESWFPLTAKHRVNNVLMYEVEEKLKIGIEGYYFSKQKLTDGAIGKSYWIFGLMGEKVWKSFSLFINFENFTDTRQTKFDTIYTGTITNPVFRDIYAPVDGFVVNGGIKIRL